MTTKQDVLTCLQQAKDYLSGEQIAQALDISRAAVWKWIDALRREGYEIESRSGRGYRLLSTPDVMTQAAVLAERASGACITAAGALAAALPGVFLFCGTTALAVFFTTGSYPRIMAFFRRQLGTRLDRARGVKANLLSTLGKWFRAQAILLGVTFCELLAGFLLMGQRYALLLAAVTALVDALPVFGTGTVLLPWAAACLLLGQAPRAVALAALYAVISAVRSFLEPKVMAAQAGLPPLAALAAMYAGFRAFGVAGMILLPVALLFVKQLHDQGYVGLWK